MRSIGFVLIVLGIAMMAFTGFTLITKKKVVDAGPIQIDKKEKTPVYWSPVLGVVLLGGGILLVATDKKKAI